MDLAVCRSYDNCPLPVRHLASYTIPMAQLRGRPQSAPGVQPGLRWEKRPNETVWKRRFSQPMRPGEAAGPAYRPGPRGDMAQNGSKWLT